MRTFEQAVDRLVELHQNEFGLRRNLHYGGPMLWECGAPDGEGGFIYSGYGETPSEAAWALVTELEKAEEFRRGYFGHKDASN